MLKVLFFYLFVWWFVKLESIKVRIVRAVIAGVLMIFYMIAVIVICSDPYMQADGSALLGLVGLVPGVLFLVRCILDVIYIIKHKKNDKN